MTDLLVVLGTLGVPAKQTGDTTWVVRIPTDQRGDLPVQIAVGERNLRLTTFVMRGPDQAHTDVYRRLLRRHLDLDVWRFALDDDGDIYLVADLEREAAGLRLDGVLGLLAVTIDQALPGLIGMGFRAVPTATA